MVTKIPMATHKIATQIEDEPLPWNLVNVVVDPDTGEILQYKDLIKVKEQKTRYFWKNELSKEFGRLTDGFPGKVQKGKNTFFGCTKQYTSGIHSHILAHRSRRVTKEEKINSGTTKCRSKSN